MHSLTLRKANPNDSEFAYCVKRAASGTTVAAECLKVNQLFLLQEHHGKDIGRTCMLLIMEEARQLGLPVRLRVMKVNPRALAF